MNDDLVLGKLPYLGRRVLGQVAPNEHNDHILILMATDNGGHKGLAADTVLGTTVH